MKPANLKPLIETTRLYNRLKGVRDTERQLRYFESRAAKEIGDVFKEQGEILLTKLEEFKSYFQEEVGRDTDFALNTAFYLTFNRQRDLITRYRLIATKIAQQSFTSSVGVDTSFDLYDVGAYRELEQTAAQSVSGINEVTRTRIKKIITDGYQEKKTYAQIAREIKNEFEDFATPAPQKHIRNRAELVAVTEMRDAHETSQFRQMKDFMDKGYEMEKSWLTTKDERVCDICGGNAGAGWIGSMDIFPGGQFMAPAHPACFVKGTDCISPDTLFGIVTKYSGPVIEILDSMGDKTTVTPNHMFLTPNGFASANLLNEGDNIICCPGLKGGSMRYPNNDGGPSTIEQIIKSLSKSSGSSTTCMPVSSIDLHGDAAFTKGDVNIISPNGFLRDNIRDATRFEIRDDKFFQSGDLTRSFNSGCNLTSKLFSLAFATDRCMSGTRQPAPLFRGRLRHTEKHGFASIPLGNPNLMQPSDDHTSRNPIMFGKLLDRYSRFIKPLEIREINCRPFHGNVYDLQTISTLYIGNGLLSSNCRCRTVYRIKPGTMATAARAEA